jgi:hypothetical protein
VKYRDAAGGEAFAVTRHLINGPALVRDDALRGTLVVASAKFGGEVKLTGSAAFRRKAEAQAHPLGIKVTNPLVGERNIPTIHYTQSARPAAPELGNGR